MEKIIDKDTAICVNQKLIDWYKENKRNLPFRDSKNPYYIWVSEIMAQQTQIKTVLAYFDRFIKRFPTVEELARAEDDEIFKYWEGLGYYSRAKNLKKAAQIIVEKGFPETYRELKQLPGIGPYTAGAIASIAFGERVAAIDANVIRVISRLNEIDLDFSKLKNKNKLSAALSETMPADSGDYNQSLMELGALICTPKNPSCLLCPVREFCKAYKHNTIDLLPIKKEKIKKTIVHNAAIILLYNNMPLYQKRDSSGLLANLYGFPIFDKENHKTDSKREIQSINNIDYFKPYNISEPILIGHSKHAFTHVVWETDVYTAQIDGIPEGFTQKPSATATAFKKMLKLLKLNFQ